MSPDPVLHLLAGPNGSGKTTLARRVLLPVMHLPFVNADDIALQRWPQAQAEHAYEASEAAAAERDRLLRQRTSFVTETVFSHPSKLALIGAAQDAGYRVVLHVVVIPEDVAVLRVAHRVGRGGHRVPEDKVRQRYARLWPLVARAMKLADLTYVYDNGLASRPFRLMASFERGALLGAASWAAWTPDELR